MTNTVENKHTTTLAKTATALLVTGIVLLVGGFLIHMVATDSAQSAQWSGVGDPSGALLGAAVGVFILIVGGLALIAGIILRIINR